jgi:hypothetical protein
MYKGFKRGIEIMVLVLQNSLLLYQPTPDLPETPPPLLVSSPIISIPLFSNQLALSHHISGGEDDNLPKPCYHNHLSLSSSLSLSLFLSHHHSISSSFPTLLYPHILKTLKVTNN